MFEGLLQPMHLLVILGIALLIFGPKKLPELGKSLGEAIRGFKDSVKPDDRTPPAAQVGPPFPTRLTSGVATVRPPAIPRV